MAGRHFSRQLLGTFLASDRLQADAALGAAGNLVGRSASESPEAQTIAAAATGDPATFEKLYQDHKRRVYSLCLRMIGDPSEAEDLTQEAFLQMFRKIGTFRGEAAFSTWLHRLTVNLVLMRLRKKSLRTTSLDEPSQDQDDNRPMQVGSNDAELVGSVDRIALERAVDKLPPGYRLVFQLHDVEGYEHQEIAGMVGCSVGNSKSQLHKARLKLRELLKSRPLGAE